MLRPYVLTLSFTFPICFFFIFSLQALSADHWRIAVVQSIKHPALDEVASGIRQHFHYREIYPEFILVVADYDVGSVNGEPESVGRIREFNPDMIVTIGTQASQELPRWIDSVPVVFTAVTDPVGAGLVNSMSEPGGRLTGLTDMSPVAAQLDMIVRIQPDIENLGMVFSEFEQNAVTIKDHLSIMTQNYGIRLVTAPVKRGDKVLDIASDILHIIDALYVSTDNYVVSSITSLAELCVSEGVPLYAADSSSVAGGAMVSLSIDYYRMGLQTGAMSQRILEGADPKNVPVEKPREFSIAVNVQAAEEMGIALPVDLIMAADIVYSSFQENHP